MLIQIDKLVQLLESPVFTCMSFLSFNNPKTNSYTDLRLQLLEPEKYPYLYKCLYGVLMLLPQSSAFAALKNRLNSVSNIGFLHGGPRRYGPREIPRSPVSPMRLTEAQPSSTAQTAPPSSFDRSSGTRLKARDENTIRWVDLLDKFKSVQERARRSQASQRHSLDPSDTLLNPTLTAALSAAAADRSKDRSGLPDAPRGAPAMNPTGNAGAVGPGIGNAAGRGLDSGVTKSVIPGPSHKHKSSLPNLGRLGIGGRKKK